MFSFNQSGISLTFSEPIRLYDDFPDEGCEIAFYYLICEFFKLNTYYWPLKAGSFSVMPTFS